MQTEFNMYVDLVIIVDMFCEKILVCLKVYVKRYWNRRCPRAQKLGEKSRGIESQKKNEDPTDNSIIEIDKYSVKSKSKNNKLFGKGNPPGIMQKIGGARGIMVIIVGNGHGDTSSNPGRDWLYFT